MLYSQIYYNIIIDLAAVCKVSVDQILGRDAPAEGLSPAEQHLLELYSALNYDNKIKAEERMRALLDSQK